MTLEEKSARADRLVFWCSLAIAVLLFATGAL
jgi:hypothetical protein